MKTRTKLKAKNIDIDVLAEEQVKYLNSWYRMLFFVVEPSSL